LIGWFDFLLWLWLQFLEENIDTKNRHFVEDIPKKTPTKFDFK